MEAPDFISIPKNVAPNETVEISIDLIAPPIEGRYKGVWILQDEKGNQFGLGANSRGEIWVQIRSVILPTSVPTETPEPLPTATVTPTAIALFANSPAEDLLAENCAAAWSNNNGTLACPGSAREAQSSASLVTNAALEDGSIAAYPAIAVIPGAANGFVVGIYPDYVVQAGDHFRALAGCEANATTCAVLFRIRYQEGSNEIVDLWAAPEFYDGKLTPIDLDLTALAGKSIKLILDTKSLNSAITDRAVWVSPGIYRETPPTAAPTVTPFATSTATPTTLAPTVAAAPTAAPAPASQAPAQPSMWQTIQEFFQNLFGG